MSRMISEPPVATRSQDKILAKVGENEPIFVIRANDEDMYEMTLIWLSKNPQIPWERKIEVLDIAEQSLKWAGRHKVA